MFQPKTHTLNWSIKGTDKEITTVTIRPMTMGEHRAQCDAHKGKDNDKKLLRSCIVASTNLSANEIKQLMTPDHTSLQNQVVDFLKQPAKFYLEEIFEKKLCTLNEQYQTLLEAKAEQSEIDAVIVEIDKQKFNVNRPQLLIPIVGDDGKSVTCYKLKPPTVHITDLMDTYDDEWERTIFISANCTGLSENELGLLCLPDWNQLQGRLIDFLAQSAEYFRQKT